VSHPGRCAHLAHLAPRSICLVSYGKTPCGAARVCSPKRRIAPSVAASLLGAMRGARMASKRSHRGRRVGPPRCFIFPWEEKDRRVSRERELAREAKRWDEDRIRRFEEDQRRKREWINFAEIAEWFSELGGSGPNEAECEKAFRMLERDLLAGLFE